MKTEDNTRQNNFEDYDSFAYVQYVGSALGNLVMTGVKVAVIATLLGVGGCHAYRHYHKNSATEEEITNSTLSLTSQQEAYKNNNNIETLLFRDTSSYNSNIFIK
ncbi:MAG: hypothetical protein ACP5N3_04275 [Candidatus Nanoarchaeia archaeon]